MDHKSYGDMQIKLKHVESCDKIEIQGDNSDGCEAVKESLITYTDSAEYEFEDSFTCYPIEGSLLLSCGGKLSKFDDKYAMSDWEV